MKFKVAGLLAASMVVGAPADAAYSLHDFTLLGSSNVSLHGINDLGAMVGSVYNGETSYGFIVRGDEVERISDSTLGDYFIPWGISNTGAVAVSVSGAADNTTRAYLYEGGKFTLVGEDMYVRGISPDGAYLTGYSSAGSFTYDIARRQFSAVPELALLQDVNSHGVGVGQVPLPVEPPYYWSTEAGAMVDLSSGSVRTLRFDTTTDPYRPGATRLRGINDRGDVAGWATADDFTFGFHYSADGVLERFSMPGASTTWAQGLNNAGVIVGYYFLESDVDVARAFIAMPSPVPEPGAAWLLSMGMVGLVVAARHQRASVPSAPVHDSI